MAGVVTGLPVLSTDAFPAVAAGSQIQVSEAMLGQAMQNAYTNGASPTLWIVPPGPKRTISTFVGRSTTQVLVGKTEVVSTVDVLATDFGRIKVAPSRWVPSRCLVANRSGLRCCSLLQSVSPVSYGSRRRR